MKTLRRWLAKPFWWIGNKIAPCWPVDDENRDIYELKVFVIASEKEANDLWDEMNAFVCEQPAGCHLGFGVLNGPLKEDEDEAKMMASVTFAE